MNDIRMDEMKMDDVRLDEDLNGLDRAAYGVVESGREPVLLVNDWEIGTNVTDLKGEIDKSTTLQPMVLDVIGDVNVIVMSRLHGDKIYFMVVQGMKQDTAAIAGILMHRKIIWLGLDIENNLKRIFQRLGLHEWAKIPD